MRENDHTLSTTIDLNLRTIKFHGIAKGRTMDQIIANNSGTFIGQEIAFGISDEVIMLDQPLSSSLEGVNYSISEIPIQRFERSADSFCEGQQDSITGFFSKGVAGLGDIDLSSSLFQSHSDFRPNPDAVFSINPTFLYDQEDSTIREDIEKVFPNVIGFQWYYEFELADNDLLSALGFVTVDPSGSGSEFYLRGFDLVQNGNFVEITFNEDDLVTDENATEEQLTGFKQLTDRIFSGGKVFILEIPAFDNLYEFYNPCNKYKGFIAMR